MCYNQKMHIILASQSPRRRDLLVSMGLQFEVVPSNFEEQLDSTRDPIEVAKELGLGKAQEVAERFPEALVIASDTIVTLDGEQFGKPADEAEARAILTKLAGRAHLVTSSLTLVCKAQNIAIVDADNTKVVFKPFDAAAVDAYIATGDWKDKAAYGFSVAAPLIDHIEGAYDTILGLPTALLARHLRELGVADVQPAVLAVPSGVAQK